MYAFYVSSCILFSLLYGSTKSATWSADSLLDNQQMFICAGTNVTFTWKYTLDEGEELGDIQWLYNGHSQELVAIFTRGTFIPTPTFSQRVTWMDNAGLTLSKVQEADSGNYSVEVSIHRKDGALTTLLRRTLTVNVSEHMVTTDDTLHVVQDPDPVYNSTTSQWVIQLQCGNFIPQNILPYYVQWTTPSGRVYNSTSFSQGHFYFHIPMPVETGNYVCSIPAHLASRDCLLGSSQRGVALRVESMEARLLLLEKENTDLKHKLATTATNLQTRLGKLEEAKQNQVAFHAKDLRGTWVDANTPLKFNVVIYNQGYAYSPYTGYFTAPYSGLYLFFAKTASYSENSEENHDLMVDDNKIDEGFSVDPFGVGNAFPSPVHGVIHLTPGQQVYVKLREGKHVYTHSSSFTGFLLSHDP